MALRFILLELAILLLGCSGGRPHRWSFCLEGQSRSQCAILDTVARGFGRINACYERLLVHRGSSFADEHARVPAGKVVLHWMIEANGTVSSVDARSETLGDAATIDCMADVIRRLQFPPEATPDGKAVPVTFPLAFRVSEVAE